jgi:dipeptidase
MRKLNYFLALVCTGFTGSFACTTIIVGKNATSDGSILVGRNVDAGSGNSAVNFLYHPPRKDGYVYKNTEESDNTFTYQLPNNLMGYSGVPDWQTNYSSFEEVGFNDAGAGISATETIQSNPQTLKVDPYVTSNGIIEEAIPTILLPQMKSAREGVMLLGKIIETSGSGEGFGVVFVDKNEVWYLENAGGHQWLAVRVPDNAYFVSANQSRLGKVDLKDSKNYLASPNLITFAEKNGLYNPKQDGEFNFHKVYGQNNATDVAYNYPRVTYLQGKYTAKTLKHPVNDGDFPVFLKPDHKLSVADVESGLQNYYQGTASDPYTSQNPKATARPISVYRTQQSHVLQVRSDLPAPIANVEYLELGMTALGIYLPFYQGATIPENYKLATGKADSDSAYWKFRKVQALALLNFPKYAPLVQARYAQLNQQISLKQKEFEELYRKEYKKDPLKAKQMLDQFTQATVNEAFLVSDELANQIITDKSDEINKTYKFHGD